MPQALLNLDITIDKYAKTNGDRLFVPINTLNRNFSVPKKLKTRHYPIVTTWTGYDSDTLIMELPAGYQIEYMPDTLDIASPFGMYKTQLSITDGILTYIRTLKVYKGSYPAIDYVEFRNFFKKIANADDANLILKKT